MSASITIPSFTVTGHIFDQFNTAIVNTKVQAFDKDLRSEQLLGTINTDTKGQYSIIFPALAAIQRESKTPDVFIRVFDSRGQLLGQSKVFFNIPASVIIDFKVGNTEINPLNEFDALVQLLQPLVSVSNLQFKDLEEKEPNLDISFLAGETGKDFDKIEFIVKAFTISNKTQIEPDIFYGFFRMGFPTVLNELLVIKSDSLKNALQQAMDDNIISPKWQIRLDEVIKKLNAIAAKIVLAGNDEQSAAFKKLFGSTLSVSQQKIFTTTYYDSEDEPEKFWDKLKQQSGFGGAVAEKAKRLLNLNMLTDNQPELAQHLFSRQASDPDLKEMSGYAKFSKLDWHQQITNAAVTKFPAWVKGETTEDKVSYYAETLEQLHKELYPTTFFAARIKQDRQSSFVIKEQLNVFFTKNPDFDLNTKNIQKQFDSADFDDIPDKEALKKELKTLNRLYKLTDDYNQVKELYGKKLFSSADIVKKYGREKFVKELAPITGGADKALQLYKKAVSVNNKATALIVGYKSKHDIPLKVIDGDQDAPEGYHEMFRDRELCECEHCQSVYSPSAYFVDILHFIMDRNEAAFKELLRRRPDLEHILLTCKNTNTPLPYIDLVNELLEMHVAHLAGITGRTGGRIEAQSYQTEGLASELIAMPEHVNREAYEPLQTVTDDAVFSALLPFDLPIEEIRTYTEKLGWNRVELMEAFYGNNEPGRMNDPTIAAELFGFSNSELNIINGTNAITVSLPFNDDGKCIIKALLEKTKLTFIELLQLLQTYFLNPTVENERTLTIDSPLFTCNLDEMDIIGASNEWFNKLVRFVRLWKKIGWDIYELDRTLTVLEIEDFPATEASFNEQLLIPFAHIERIKRQLNIPIRQVITFFGNIDTANYVDYTKAGHPIIPSLYRQVFQDKTFISDFSNSPFHDSPEDLSGILADHAETICAVLGIAAGEFVSIATDTELSIQSLSRLYRDVLLARSLNATIVDTKEIIKIIGNVPADGIWSSSQLFQFLEEWKVFNSSGIKPNEFYSIISNNNGAEYQIPVTLALIGMVQEKIDSLITIKNDEENSIDKQKEKYAEVLKLFLNSFSGNEALKNSLLLNLSSQDDIALKTAIENFLGDKNRESLELLTGEELIEKLNKLKNSLSDYFLIKTTPLVFKHFPFSPAEIIWLRSNKAATVTAKLWENNNEIFDIDVYPDFRTLLHIWLIANIKTEGTSSWTSLFDIAIENFPGAKEAWIAKFISLYAVEETALIFLCGLKEDVNSKGQLHLSFPEDYIKAENLLGILNCCKIIEKLGGNNAQLNALLGTNALPKDPSLVESLLKSRYGSKEWLDVIKPINDRLRKRRRDAMVAWLLANTNGGKWHSKNDLYEWLLIDTEMEACMVTSRIKQGISSIQLFIDRSLMNLERNVQLDNDFAEQWHSWRKQYRVWEANRKVFLYPENWIELDLRDDKSPFFKELESQLKQNEVTEETAQEALITYLQKLDTVANLEIVGLFNDEETKIVHVFGRTQNIPHQYFYRKQENRVWTAWEKVELDIEGDHILPVVWNGRLMLFWTQFTEKEERLNAFTVPPVGGTIENPLTYFEIRLAWSEFKNRKWTAKKISKDFVKTPLEFTPNELLVNSKISEGKLLITFFFKDPSEPKQITNTGLGQFVFDGCNGSPRAVQIEFFSLLVEYFFLTTGITADGVFLKEKRGEADFPLTFYKSGVFSDQFSDSASLDIFRNTPGFFKLLPNYNEFGISKKMMAFYSNEKNVLFALGKSIKRSGWEDLFISDLNIVLARKSEKIKNKKYLTKEHALVKKPLWLPEAHQFSNKTVYSFQTFYHPYVCSYIKKITADGINGLYDKEVQAIEPKEIFTIDEYNPTPLVTYPHPKEEVDFSYKGSYSMYNWELFFHIPLLIATGLTQNQQFQEARKWFHYIFDPTRSSSNETGVERFWITKPFTKEIEENVLSLEDLLSREDYANDLEVQLANWEKNPFNPHAVARLRISAYMRNTLLRYIDNLIQWGDQLFRRDTIESINEATLLYILASNILGKKPEVVPARGKPVEESFSLIKDGLDRFSNVKAEIESFISPSSGDDNILMPYFCLPKNDYLLKYWDMVADRLFKIRHCMNIEGLVRQLPLFEPPIDPALLVRATAAGLNLNEILNDLTVGMPNYRFQVMLQQANELCNDVKSLGGALLSALEKKDGEEMALLRSAHELRMLEMIKDIKEKQRDEAKENLESLLDAKTNIQKRIDYYTNRINRNQWEDLHYKLLLSSNVVQDLMSINATLASLQHVIPQVNIGPWIMGSQFGGFNLANATEAALEGGSFLASSLRTSAELAGTYGSEIRRKEESIFQAKSAELELKQIEKQIIAAEIRLAIAEKEIENHSLQMEQSKEVDDYMRGKFTNAELYDWMVGQLSTVYFQSYQLAYATAKKAEKCLQHELGLEGTNYVQFGYWDSLKKGLLSGEKLQYDLRRLESAYLEENKREYEITQHFSLYQIDPEALINLKITGKCTFILPELAFDLLYPGQYNRRIRGVRISIPCIAGPYTNVSAELKLKKSSIRDKENINSIEKLPEVVFLDPESITTSSAQNDSGTFEFNFRDERYLPFEYAGAVESEWELSLPSKIRSFNYDSISDVIIHMSYTANTGNREEAEDRILDKIKAFTEPGMLYGINLKHDCPNEWHHLKRNGGIDLSLEKTRLPYFVQGLQLKISHVNFFTKKTEDAESFNLIVNGKDVTLSLNTLEDNKTKFLQGDIKNEEVNQQIDFGKTLRISATAEDLENLEELFLVVRYEVS